MNTSDEKNSAVKPDEERFVQRALAKVEKAERFHLVKQIVVTVIAFPAVYYLMGSAPERRVPFTVIMVIGLLLAGITAKLVWVVNKNKEATLPAIAVILTQRRIYSGGEGTAPTTPREDKENES